MLNTIGIILMFAVFFALWFVLGMLIINGTIERLSKRNKRIIFFSLLGVCICILVFTDKELLRESFNFLADTELRRFQ